MNLKNPRTYNEKIQWLKNHGDIELKSKLTDKFDVREYVASRVGKKYLVDLLPLNSNRDLCVSSADCIDWDMLPSQFALKLTKGSGFNIICNDKSALNKRVVFDRIKKWLEVNNYYLSREPQYKGQNKIIAEKLLEYNIKDYKFFCFDSEPKMFKVDINRFNGHHANYYDLDWNLFDLDEGGCPHDPTAKISKPKEFEEMIDVARKLAQGWPFVRIDLYVYEGNVYFGEMTFHPSGGYTPLYPDKWQLKFGNLIKLKE